MKKIIFLTLVAFALSSNVLFAEEVKPADKPVETKTLTVTETGSKKGTCLTCPAEKLGRGVSNVVFSPFELPYRIGKEMEVQDPVGAFATGTLKGVFWFATRFVVGAVDTVTFFIPTKPMIGEFDSGWWAA